jgi:hypothetical protein
MRTRRRRLGPGPCHLLHPQLCPTDSRPTWHQPPDLTPAQVHTLSTWSLHHLPATSGTRRRRRNTGTGIDRPVVRQTITGHLPAPATPDTGHTGHRTPDTMRIPDVPPTPDVPDIHLRTRSVRIRTQSFSRTTLLNRTCPVIPDIPDSPDLPAIPDILAPLPPLAIRTWHRTRWYQHHRVAWSPPATLH